MRPLIALILLLAGTTLTQAQTSPAPPAATEEAPVVPIEQRFPFVIKFHTWRADEGFRRGDKITITTVRGDRKKIEPGGTYLVQGTYTLGSAMIGTLALSLTSTGQSPGGAWGKDQFYKIERGTGAFSLIATMRYYGDYHVSFYLPKDSKTTDRKAPTSSAGGIYFN